MAKAKEIKWPPPPERDARDALQQYLGQEAARLLEEYRKGGKGGSGTGQQRWRVRGAALDLLRTTNAPLSLIILFDVMLGGVSTELSRIEPREPWLDLIVDYEARAHQAGREVTNAELTDNVVRPANSMAGDRDHVMRKVRRARRATDWYPALVLSRRVYLIDNPETV